MSTSPTGALGLVAAGLAGVLVAGLAAVPGTAHGAEPPDEDLTEPVLTLTPKAGGIGGWYADTATVDVRATDDHPGASGVLRIAWQMTGATAAAGNLPPRAGGTLTVTNSGVTTIDVDVADGNDNHASGRVDIGIDRTPPTVAPPPGLSGAELVRGTTFPANFSCADGQSGIVTCAGSVAVGQPVFTGTPGQHTFTVTARDRVGRVGTTTIGYTVLDNVFTVTQAARVEGTPAVGELVTIVDPQLTPQPTALSYRWFSGNDLVGTDRTYRVTEADRGRTVSAQVRPERAGVASVDLPAGQVVIPEGTIEIDGDLVILGEARAGSSLQMTHGNVTPNQAGLSYEWFRDGALVQSGPWDGFDLGDGDIGHRITGRMVASAPGYTTRTSEALGAVVVQGRQLSVSGTASVVGTPQVGSELTARPPVVATPIPRGPAAQVTLGYQWLRDGQPVPGATAATYRLQPADAGRRMAVVVTGTATGYETVRNTSPDGPPVASATPELTANVKALGNGKVRLTVTVAAPGVVPTGEVSVRRGRKVLADRQLQGDRVLLKLRRQRTGKVTYTVTYAGAPGIEARTVKVTVKVR